MNNKIYSHFDMVKIMVCFLAIGIFVGAYYFITETTNDIKMQDQQFLSEISVLNSSLIEKNVHTNLDKIEAIANFIGIQDECSKEDILKILKSESNRCSFKRMGYASIDGQAITTDNEILNVGNREYFLNAVAGQSSVSDRIVDKVDGNYINVYAVPLIHKENTVGVIFVTSDNNLFANELDTTIFGGDGYSYIITNKGVPVVYSKNCTERFDNVFDDILIYGTTSNVVYEVKNNMLNGHNGVVEYKGEGVERIAAYSRVGVNDWYVVSVVPKYAISKNTNRLIHRNNLIVFTTIVTFIFLILSTIVQYKKNRLKLEKLAYYYDFTGAPTLAKFKIEAQRFINDNKNKKLLMVKFDIDRFKLINQILGDRVGDLVIKNIALALRFNTPGSYERFARIHDDEFLVLHVYEKVEELKDIRERFQEIFGTLMGNSFVYEVKMVSGHYDMSSEDCFNVSEAIEKANIAHRKAKHLGNEICVYDKVFLQQARRNKEIENKMKTALLNQEFEVYLQPKYDTRSEVIIGAEALVRWKEKNGNMIYPNEFIPLFESNGFIIKLDLYMFERVCQVLKEWIEGGKTVVTVSVNFSRLHLSNPNLVSQLKDITDQYQIPKRLIEIELTETVIYDNEDTLVELLNELHKEGFTLAMDDFGTGYSSLGLLKNLPVDVIKMDRNFFTNNTFENRAKKVVECVMYMAHELSMVTVAEGVETKEQVEFLRQIGCDIIQGYYYAKPMPYDEFSTISELNKEGLKRGG